MNEPPIENSDRSSSNVTGEGPEGVPAPGELSVRSFPELPGVELWTAKRWARPLSAYTWAYAFCALDDDALEGGLSWRYRRTTYSTGRTSTMLLEPDEIHVTTHVREPVNYHMVLVDPVILDAGVADDGGHRRRDRHFQEPQIDCPVAH